MQIITKNQQETKKFAQKFAKKLKNSEVICLKGDLGVGKTVFVKGMASGLGIEELITSPTFVLVKEYQILATKCQIQKLYHIDCYRLNNAKELLDLGFKKWLKHDNIIVIEWADKVREILPKKCIWVEFEVMGENERKIKIVKD